MIDETHNQIGGLEGECIASQKLSQKKEREYKIHYAIENDGKGLRHLKFEDDVTSAVRCLVSKHESSEEILNLTDELSELDNNEAWSIYIDYLKNCRQSGKPGASYEILKACVSDVYANFSLAAAVANEGLDEMRDGSVLPLYVANIYYHGLGVEPSADKARAASLRYTGEQVKTEAFWSMWTNPNPPEDELEMFLHGLMHARRPSLEPFDKLVLCMVSSHPDLLGEVAPILVEAALDGNELLMQILVWMYDNGIGVDKNPIKAGVWQFLALEHMVQFNPNDVGFERCYLQACNRYEEESD